MDPNYQNPSPVQPNPYDFMLNQDMPPKGRLSLFGGSFVRTIGLLVGGALLIMLLTVILINIFGHHDTSKVDFQSLAQTKNKLVRITTLPTQHPTQQHT